ncbi:MAG: FkbM family methyltransferase [Croceibacterium sp.]
MGSPRLVVPPGDAAFGTSTADLVYDVGAHLGEDSDFYLRLGFRVVAVEAHPGHAAVLRERFATEIAAGRFVLVARAVAPGGRPTDFYVNDVVSVWGTIEGDWAERNAKFGASSQKISVPSIDPVEILRENGVPFYLKVDVEGADTLFVSSLEQFTARPQYLSLEASSDDLSRRIEEFDLLERLGYRKFKVVKQGRHGRGRFTTREGGSIDYEFDQHSSGRFGPQLGKRWLTRRQALRRYFLLEAYGRIFDPHGILGRVLVKLPVLRRIPQSLSWFDTHAML